jgi:hypothetical protein
MEQDGAYTYRYNYNGRGAGASFVSSHNFIVRAGVEWLWPIMVNFCVVHA